MNSARYRRIKEVFHRVADADAGARDEILARECGGDTALIDEIRTLLRHDDADDAFSDDRRVQGDALLAHALHSVETAHPDDQPVGATAPAMIGRYRVLRMIGEGGMGVVYEAEQDQPNRRVALKVIRPGLATDESLRRFRREGEVLGRLQHAGIAHIYDAGVAKVALNEGAPFDLPYFAMELIHGESITEFADSRSLSSDERLELIARVADAIHHAHRQGVVHRDLKPSNILVIESSGQSPESRRLTNVGDPKIVDFGVARAAGSNAKAVTMQTTAGQLMGTLPYMSPEQLDERAINVDARTDVYALGVITYQLLTGRLPHDVRHRSLADAARIIIDDEPATLGTVNRALRGDVETIVAKTLEKEPGRRYATAADLSADIRRYLQHEPIVARPATRLYQLRKFAHRHKGVVAALVATFVVLVAGVIVSTSLAFRARRAETLANQRLEDALAAQQQAEEQRAEAAYQAKVAEEVNRFLNEGMLAAANPARSSNRDTTVREVLDAAADNVAQSFQNEPAVRAGVQATIGTTYGALGLYEQSQVHLETALDLCRKHLGLEHLQTLDTMAKLARLYVKQAEYGKAEELAVRVLAACRNLYGEHNLRTAEALDDLGHLYLEDSQYDRAEKLHREALDINRSLVGEDHNATLTSKSNLATILFYKGRYADSLKLQQETLDSQRRVLGQEHPKTLTTMTNVAYVYDALAQYDASERLARETIEIQKRVLGKDHPDTLKTMSNLCVLYQDLNRFDEAKPLRLEIIERQRNVLGDEHPETLTSKGYLAEILAGMGELDQAERLYQQTIEAQGRILGDGDPGRLACMHNLALMYMDNERYEDAIKIQHRVLEGQKQALGQDHPYALLAMGHLARSYHESGKSEQALPLLQHLVEVSPTVLPPGDRHIGLYHAVLGDCLTNLQRFDEAEKHLLEGHKILAKALGEFHRGTMHAMKLLVSCYHARGDEKSAKQWQAKIDAASDDSKD